jgi:hypothetical protein
MGVCRLQSSLTRPHSQSISRSSPGNQPKFDTIASACGLGIGLDNFIAMTRLARTSDSGAARFLDAWDALEDGEQLSAATADAICEQIGLAPLDLLKAVADATIRFSMYTARLRAAVAMPSIVERSIEVGTHREWNRRSQDAIAALRLFADSCGVKIQHCHRASEYWRAACRSNCAQARGNHTTAFRCLQRNAGENQWGRAGT